jgi:hypothetical protein
VINAARAFPISIAFVSCGTLLDVSFPVMVWSASQFFSGIRNPQAALEDEGLANSGLTFQALEGLAFIQPNRRAVGSSDERPESQATRKRYSMGARTALNFCASRSFRRWDRQGVARPDEALEELLKTEENG